MQRNADIGLFTLPSKKRHPDRVWVASAYDITLKKVGFPLALNNTIILSACRTIKKKIKPPRRQRFFVTGSTNKQKCA